VYGFLPVDALFFAFTFFVSGITIESRSTSLLVAKSVAVGFSPAPNFYAEEYIKQRDVPAATAWLSQCYDK
jgi:hypothetical protein